MARDYTKYQVNGIDGIFGKGKLVLAVVTDYCLKNKCSFNELKKIFPDDVQAGSTGVFGTLVEAKEIAKKRKRHYIKNPIKLTDTKIAVSNQWGSNITLFIETAKDLGYEIYVAGGKNKNTEFNKSNNEERLLKVKKNELKLFDKKLIKGHEPWADGNDSETPGHYFAFIILAFSFNTDQEGHNDEIDAIHNFQRKLWDVGNQISEIKYNERMDAVLKWYNAVQPEGVHNWIEYGVAILKANKERLNPRFFNLLLEYLINVACANSQITDDEKVWLSWILACVEWDISDEIKKDLAKIGIVQDHGLTDYQIDKGEVEEDSIENENAKKKYPMLPSSWGLEHVLVVPIRDCILSDGKVDQMEHNNLAHFFENFGQIGHDCYDVWDETDEILKAMEKNGLSREVIIDSAIYLKENLDDEQLSKLIWYMAEIVCQDDVIQYNEYNTLRFYLDQWYPQAMDNYLQKFKNAGMTIITTTDN